MSIASDTKAGLRKELAQLYSQKNLSEYTHDAVTQIITPLVWKQATEVLAYAPLPDELAYVWELMNAYPQKTWFFPRVHDNTMQFVQVRHQNEFAPGTFGIKEPLGTDLWHARMHRHAVCLVPARALDSAGNRLGRGRGFYDRFLNTHANDVTTMSIVPDFAFVYHVPTETHDQKIDFPLKACCST